MKTKKKRSSLKISPLFGSKSLPRFCPFVCLNFLPKLQRGGGGGHAAILHTILCQLYYPGNPKGGHGTRPPLNTPLCGNYSMEKNNNKVLVPNAYKTQIHLQTLCLHLSLLLLQHHLQCAYYRNCATFLTSYPLIRI